MANDVGLGVMSSSRVDAEGVVDRIHSVIAAIPNPQFGPTACVIETSCLEMICDNDASQSIQLSGLARDLQCSLVSDLIDSSAS